MNASGKPFRMPCFDVLIELLFGSFTSTTIVGTDGCGGSGDFSFSLAIRAVGVDNVVVIVLMSCIFF